MEPTKHLTERPCEYCDNHTENGCSVWDCPFDKKDNEKEADNADCN